ncbi:hypothetical protein [Altererythrobacter sp. MF3-039]|uniref:hypothetical protein n=1 Tax=Altererythrobacter sp. MF3-039 TaxID=3252901 RepID=UPI00390CC097
MPAETTATANATAEAIEVCGADGTRFASDREALDTGLDMALFGATMCPEYQMHPSWDADQDGSNDCYNDQTCDVTVDYTAPRPTE